LQTWYLVPSVFPAVPFCRFFPFVHQPIPLLSRQLQKADFIALQMEDVKMTDVGEVEDVKSPESMLAVMSSSPRDYSTQPLQSTSGELDSWIELLSKCKQLPEDDVKRLCDTVPPLHHHQYTVSP
jgi:hypothetical protein